MAAAVLAVADPSSDLSQWLLAEWALCKLNDALAKALPMKDM
jgi:hypothetical protein